MRLGGWNDKVLEMVGKQDVKGYRVATGPCGAFAKAEVPMEEQETVPARHLYSLNVKHQSSASFL